MPEIELTGDETRIVEATRSAMRSSSRVRYSGSNQLDQTGYGLQERIWGSDAGIDYIETHWARLINLLKQAGEEREMHSDVMLPQTGGRAAAAIVGFAKERLPSFDVVLHRQSLTVSWEKCTLPSGKQR